jgi:hypothetical protein
MDLETFIVTVYCEVDDFVKQCYPARHLRQRGPLPRLSDSEVITIEIVGEYLGLNTEKAIYQYFQRHWKRFFPRLPDRSNFVRQCANLWAVKKAFFEQLQKPWQTNIQIVDSMPLEVCEFVRAHRSRLFKGAAAYGKWFGQTVYGFKLHLKINRLGMVRSFDLTQANTHDLKVLPQLTGQDANGWILGDKGYRSKPMIQQLREEQNLTLHTPVRINEKAPDLIEPALHKHLTGVRRLIETVNGQLEQHFHIKDIWARDLWHLIVRIIRKIVTHTFCVLLNLRLNRDPLQLKGLVC